MARRVSVCMVLGCFLVWSAVGCGNREGRLRESRRLTNEGSALRDEGWKTGDKEKLEEGQKLIDKGAELREQALEGT